MTPPLSPTAPPTAPPDARPAAPRTRTRTTLRWTLAVAYLVAGIAHVAIPHPFLRITPAWVPYPTQIILLTGLCELAGAVALLTTRFRWWAGVMLAAYAVCVYPANVKHAIDQVLIAHQLHSLWYHVPRLLLQPVIVWWALFAGGVTDWPLRRGTATKRPVAHAESDWTVDVTEAGIVVTDRTGVTKSVRNTDLSRVLIETNDSGPCGAEVWWLLFAGDTLAAAYPQGAAGEAAALDYLIALPGFDSEQMVMAMGSVDNRLFPVWQKTTAA